MKIIKLTEKQELEICEKYKDKNLSCDGIRFKYQISPQRLYKIVRKHGGRVRGDITPEIVQKLIDYVQKDDLSLTEACKLLDICTRTATKYLKLNNIPIKRRFLFERKYTLDINFFDSISSHEKAQFLGLLYADGCAKEKNQAIELTLQAKDKEYLEAWMILLNSNKPLYFKPGGEFFSKSSNKIYVAQDAWSLVISDKHFYKQAVRCGVIPRKTWLNISFPRREILNEEYDCSFILGLFEGDGCISWSKKLNNGFCFTIAGGKNLCEDIIKIIKTHLGIDGNLYKRKNIYVASFARIQSVLKIINWIYSKSSVKMSRKYEKCQEVLLILKNKGHNIE